MKLFRQPDDFGGGNDLGPIEGGTGWVLACVYTLAVLVVVGVAFELAGWVFPLIDSVIAP